MSQATNKQAVLVIGPHRSGTSVVAKAMESAGYFPGRDLLEPNAENPKGFFESKAVNSFNDRLLEEIGLCWDFLGFVGEEQEHRLARVSMSQRREASALVETVFSSSPKLAIKDPRLCILEPFWSSVLEDLGYQCRHVLVVRHPLESATSQCKRFSASDSLHLVGATLSESVHLWATYLLQAIKNLAGKRVHAIDYASLLANPRRVLDRMRIALDLPGGELDSKGFCELFLDAGLNRSGATEMAPEVLAQFAPYIEVYEQILGCMDQGGNAIGFDMLEDVARLLESTMEQDKALPRNQLALYVRARHVALTRALDLRSLRQELQHAGNIIRYNEDLIERLGSGRGATDDTE